MKFALLGIDDATLALAQAVANSSEHTLVGLCEVDESPFAADRAALYQFAIAAKDVAGWESLLDERLADAVLVARAADHDHRGEQLRKLVQAGRPLIVSHPICDSMVGYEADMARSENHCTLLAYLPQRWHPAVAELAGWLGQPANVNSTNSTHVDSSALGISEQWIFERQLSDRSKSSVVAAFARDVDLIRALAGDVTRLAAFGPQDQQAAYATLHVQMTAMRAPTIRWSVASPEGRGGARLTVIGSVAKAILTMPADGEPWTLERSGGSEPVALNYPQWQPAAVMIERLSRVMQGHAAAPVWLEAIRSIELAETIDRSLRRGRAVDLKIEEASEASNFKGTMAAVGCGLLLIGTLVLFLVGVAHGLRGSVEWPAQLLGQWPKLLLGLLGLFLLLQFLLLVTRKREPSDPP